MAGEFVSDGLSRGEYWFTARRQANGSVRRVVSPYLPIRKTREEAQQDLEIWQWKGKQKP